MSPPQVSSCSAALYPSRHRHRWAHAGHRKKNTAGLLHRTVHPVSMIYMYILLVLAYTHTNCYGTLYLLRKRELQVTVVIEIEHVFSVDWCCCRRRHQTSTPYRHCQGNINNSRWSRTIDSTVTSWNCSSCHHCGHEAIAAVSTAVIKLKQLSALRLETSSCKNGRYKAIAAVSTAVMN